MQSVFMRRSPRWMVRGPATGRSSLRSSAYVTIAIPIGGDSEPLDDVPGQSRHGSPTVDDGIDTYGCTADVGLPAVTALESCAIPGILQLDVDDDLP